jgi:6-phospho-beta-glucosidase
MKVAVLGGGGFRTPTLVGCLAQVAGDAGIDEVVLEDVDAERLRRIRSVIEGMDQERGGAALAVRPTTSLEDAVDGAGAVLAAIRVGGARARVIDEEVPLSLGVLGQETVGPGGIAFALRTIPVMDRIAEVVRLRAPAAWFLTFTNPAGIVTQAVREVLGGRAVGICDSPSALCARVAAALDRRPDEVAFDYAGLNHLGWLLAADVEGRDELPGLLADEGRLAGVDEARLFGPGRLRALGAIPNEYLVYLDRADAVTRAFVEDGGRGAIVAAQEEAFLREAPPDDASGALAAWRRARDARHGSYLAEGWTVSGWDPPRTDRSSDLGPGDAGYAAVAADLLAALAGRDPRRIVVDTANAGRLDGVGDDEVVEVTCEVSAGRIDPVAGRPLPEEAAALLGRIKEVERLTVRAAVEGSARLALEAIRAHPVVPPGDLAERILDGYLERHDDLRALLR